MADYAVNVADLTRHEFVAQWLVGPVIPERIAAECEGKRRVDGMGIVLECPEEQAAAIVDVIRMKLKKHQLRCYKRDKAAWKRV